MLVDCVNHVCLLLLASAKTCVWILLIRGLSRLTDDLVLAHFSGNSQLGQKLMRLGLVVQGATVALVVGTACYCGENPCIKS